MADPTISAGWPCALLPAVPPSVADRQSNPSADEVLPQVLALTPRGAAWGRDEAGDGKNASPVMLRFWRAVASWVADINARDFEVATQTFPSATTISLGDWEAELGLPDTCTPAPGTFESRVTAVRARFGAQGGASPAYFVCLARALGRSVTLQEPTGFRVSESECIAGGIVETFFECSADGLAGSQVGLDGTPLRGLALIPADTIGDPLVGDGAREVFFECSRDGVAGSQVGEAGDPLVAIITNDPAADVWGDLIVHVPDPTVAFFECSADGVAGSQVGSDGDRIETYTPDLDLECTFRRFVPPHVRLMFRYTLPVAA